MPERPSHRRIINIQEVVPGSPFLHAMIMATASKGPVGTPWILFKGEALGMGPKQKMCVSKMIGHIS